MQLDTPTQPARRFVTVLRALGAALGSGALVAYWSAWAAHTEPRTLFLIWLVALLAWGAALFSPWPRSARRGWSLVLVIVAVTAIPRLVALSQAPYLISLDEVIDAAIGLPVLRERPWEILSGSAGYDYFQHSYLLTSLQAWPCLFLPPLTGVRVASFVQAVLSLLSTYALAHYLFGRTTAIMALTMLACSFWHMAYSRMGYQMMQPMLFIPLALYVAIRGVDTGNRFLQFVGGTLLGVTQLVYVPARIALPLFLLWLGHRVITRTLGWRPALSALAAVALGTVVVLTPHFQRYGVLDLWARFAETSAGGSGPLKQLREIGWTTPAGRELLGTQLLWALKVYVSPLGGAVFAPHDWVRSPLIDPLSLALSVCGLCIGLMHFRDSGHIVITAWVGVTFLTAQLMTDMPYGAHRATPILPALAICAGYTAAALRRWLGRWHRRWVPGLGLAAYATMALPLNLHYLDTYLSQHALDPGGTIARFIGAGSLAPVYYLVTTESPLNRRDFRFLSNGRTLRSVLSVMDVLGTPEIDSTRDAVFVLSNWMAPAASAIQRCYPGAWLQHQPSGPRADPILALSVSRDSIVAGRGCAASRDGPGLLAQYFASADAMEPFLTRVEDWPVRFTYDVEHVGRVEWSGSLQAPVAGAYQFQLLSDATTADATVGPISVLAGKISSAQLPAGRYPVHIRCRPQQAAGYCFLRWAAPGGDFGAIPSAVLRPE